MNKIHLSIMLLLVVATISIPAYADDDSDDSSRDDSSRDDSSRDDSSTSQTTNSANTSQNTIQLTQLEQRVSFLEEQLQKKDAIIAEQMKVILMLVERLNLIQ